MNRRRRSTKLITPQNAPAFDDFHEWVLSLPWVVERPYSLGTPGVRSFAVDCEPLELRRLWLLTGLGREHAPESRGIAVIVPLVAADAIENVGWGRRMTPMPVQQVMMTIDERIAGSRAELETLVLTAYVYAMS